MQEEIWRNTIRSVVQSPNPDCVSVMCIFFPLTIIGDIRDLEASGAVGFTSFEVDPQFSGPCSESYGPLVSLACLIRSDGGGRGCREHNRTKYYLELFIPYTPTKTSEMQSKRMDQSNLSNALPDPFVLTFVKVLQTHETKLAHTEDPF